MFYLLSKIFKGFTRTERFLFIGAFLLFLTASVFTTLRLYYRLTIEAPERGGRYSEAVIGQPVFVNPLIADDSGINRDLIELIFSNLHSLTKNHKISPDNKVWTLTLYDNLRWHDGQPLTAEDIVFTINAIQNSETNSPQRAAWEGVAAEKLNEQEVKLVLKIPFAFFEESWRELWIAPKHIMSVVPPANLKLSNYNLEPVGSGPYRFNGLTKRKDGFITLYELAANHDYQPAPPFIEEFQFRFFENDEEAIGAFNQKEVGAVGGLAPEKIRKLKLTYQMFRINQPRYYGIFFNPYANPQFKEKNIRLALNYAIDKKKLLAAIFQNQAILVNGPLTPGIDGYSDGGERDFSPEKTRELLDSQGLSLNIVVPKIPFLIETVNLIKSDWEKIGAIVNPLILEPAAVHNDFIKNRNYDMIIFGNILKDYPDIFSFWHSSERFYPGLNLALYDSKEADQLLEAIREDLNKESRQEKVAAVQKLIREDQPAIFLYAPHYLYAAPKNLQGFKGRFENTAEWYLKTKRVFR